MVEVLIVFFFGFPAAFLSLLLSVIGVRKEKYWLVIVGAVLFVPFSYYLSGSPGSYRIPLVLPFFQVLAAAAVREENRTWAWVLLLPAFLAVLWVAGVALFYQVR